MSESVSVVIPSLRGGRTLSELVSRLLADARLETEVVVADNGLAAAAVAELGERGARVLAMGANVGFGAAVNRAARASEGELLVLLNDDATPVPGCDVPGDLAAALGGAAEMAAGVLLQERRPDLIESAGIELDAALNPHDYLFGEPVTRLADGVAPPLGPCGGAAGFRRAAFLDVGGFDEGFFAYFEDVDLALRLRARGVRCALAPSARLVHAGSRTVGFHSLEKAALTGFSRGYFLRKYGVLRRPARAARVLAIELATCALLARRHRSLEPAGARVRGWARCSAREDWPADGLTSVGALDGLRRRYRRASRAVPERGPGEQRAQAGKRS